MDTFWGAIGAQLAVILNAYAFGTVGTLAAALVPLSATLLTLWVFLAGWRAMNGEGNLPDVAKRAAGIVVIIAFATTAALIQGPVFEVFDGLRGGLAAAFVPAGVPACPAVNPWQVLDCMAMGTNAHLNAVRTAMAALSWYDIGTLVPLTLLLLAVALGSGLLQIVNAFVIALGTFLGAFGIAVSPLFILSLSFPVTRSFFSAWLGFMVNVAVLGAVSMFALGVSLALAQWLTDRINGAGGLLATPMDPFLVGVLWFVVHAFLAVLVYQGPSISAMLIGGGGFGQGGSLVQSVLLLSRMGGSRWSSAANRSSGGSGAAVGSVAQPSRSFQAGNAIGGAGRYLYQRIAARGRRT